MYNNLDDKYEVNDLDEDIHLREALLEEAKKIDPSSEWNEVFQEISDLKRRWKRISYWESAYEDKLTEEFDACLDVFYSKRREGFQSNQSLKQELVDRATALSTSENWNQASEEMNELMSQWKAVGSAGKETDDALWEKFNAARQVFFDRKHQHWEAMQSNFEHARKVKEALIEKAAPLADSENWKETGDQLRAMMDEWKAAGSAGREHEDHLWNAFNEIRQKFYDRREQYYATLKEEFNKKYEEKKALIDQAKAIFSSNEFTKEHTEKMKQLSAEWKNIGNCGKEREDSVWKEFRTIMDDYFAGLKQFNEQKHAQWRQRMQELRSRKLELIQKQKRQIKYMQDEIVGLLGQRAIDEMEEDIADKKEFIKELEAELEEIDQALGR